jgi:hypothetical protein
VIVEWKHRKAETQLEPLLRRAEQLDPQLTRSYPRAIKDVLCAAFPVAFENHRGLRAGTVVQVLGDLYNVDHRDLLAEGDSRLAGYTYARGETAVVFTDPQYGEGFERFTLAHEAAHITVEYLPMLERSRQPELFGGSPAPAFFARRDPPGHIFIDGSGSVPASSDLSEEYARLRTNQKAWLREVVANACAAELLAPHREVSRLLASLPAGGDHVTAMQAHFGLSRRAVEVRLVDLGLAKQSSSLLFLIE